MSYFCHQVSYTKEAWARLMQNPQDRLEAVRAPIEKLGGKIHTSFFAFGAFDVLAITEFPDNISAAAISIAFAAGGAVADIQTTPLLTARSSRRSPAQSRHLRLSLDHRRLGFANVGRPLACAPVVPVPVRQFQCPAIPSG